MTCRHLPGDPKCSTGKSLIEDMERELSAARERAGIAAPPSTTPDSERYEIVDFERVGPHLVLKVLYPNCAKCSYEGNKVMVFLDVSERDFAKWKKIDPHFRESLPSTKAIVGTVKVPLPAREAPSPAARFPASHDGWHDALAYARSKERTK